MFLKTNKQTKQNFLSLHGWEEPSVYTHYTHHIFFLCPSIHGYQGWLHSLAVVNSGCYGQH